MNFNTSELSNFRNCVSEEAGSNSPGDNSKKINSRNSKKSGGANPNGKEEMKKGGGDSKSPSTIKKNSVLGIAPESSRKGISSVYSSK
tara:strand:- start:618 stop:881 length:264 start_codon:yes stop_codon:yes gene_type:complete